METIDVFTVGALVLVFVVVVSFVRGSAAALRVRERELDGLERQRADDERWREREYDLRERELNEYRRENDIHEREADRGF